MKGEASNGVLTWYRAMLGLFILFFLVLSKGDMHAIAPLAAALVLLLDVGMAFLKNTRLLTFPFLLLCLILIFCYNSYDLFIGYVWLLPLTVAAIVVHFVRLRPRFSIGPSFLPLCAVALACALGGAGRLPAAAYRTPLTLYYILGLGVGMVFAYLVFKNEIKTGRQVNDLIDDLSALALTAAGVTLGFFVLYAIPIHPTYRFQWKNNMATILMIGMPAVFARTRRSPARIVYGAFVLCAAILTFSRGAWLFAGVEFFVCVLWLWSLERRPRLKRLWSAVLIGTVVCGAAALWWLLRRGLDVVSSTETRWLFLRQGWRDFCDHPLLGQGLGNSLDMSIRQNLKGSLYWYHLFPIQILGSMGIVGALAWGWQLAVRARLAWRLRARSAFCLPLCYLGLLLMSMVNPGEFCPIPYAMLAVMIFAACENLIFPQKRWFFPRKGDSKTAK